MESYVTTDGVPKRHDEVYVRWLVKMDRPKVYLIEEESCKFPWREDDFIRSLAQRNCIGMVAEHGDSIVGFMIYKLHHYRVHLLKLAVTPNFRRKGVGAQLIGKLICKVATGRRNKILLEVRETNLTAQTFFYVNGFRAVSVLRNFYKDTTLEDAYLMQYRRPKTKK